MIEYNNNTYITILTINLVNCENKRKSNDGVITILDYNENENIPSEILNNAIDVMTHQQAMELVSTNEWISEFPI